MLVDQYLNHHQDHLLQDLIQALLRDPLLDQVIQGATLAQDLPATLRATVTLLAHLEEVHLEAPLQGLALKVHQDVQEDHRPADPEAPEVYLVPRLTEQ